MDKYRKIKIIVAALFCFAIPNTAHADPVLFDPVAFGGTLFALFVTEGIILTLLLGRKRLKILKFIAGWFFVTLATWIVFYVVSGLLSRSENDYLVLGLAEVLVVLVEAAILRIMIKFQQFTVVPIFIGYGKAFIFSFIANSASLGLGVLILDLMAP